jgi:chromosome segregation ATPase
VSKHCIFRRVLLFTVYFVRNTIFGLRRQNDLDIKSVNKLKTEKLDLQSECEAARNQISKLNTAIIELESKNNAYKMINSELSQQLQGTVHKLTQARVDLTQSAHASGSPVRGKTTDQKGNSMTDEWKALVKEVKSSNTK